MRRYLLLFLFTLSGLAAYAQPPQTQVFVFDISVRDTAVQFTRPLYLTAFNTTGYNNQPGWVDRNNLLLSVQEPGTEQPDIYSFDLARKVRTRLTRTVAGEYSPHVVGAGKSFSAVRQEFLGRDTVLRLWQFPLDREGKGQPMYGTLNRIGYYQWLNSAQIAAYLVESPSKLVLLGTDNDGYRELATSTGRCFKRQKNGNLAYVDKRTVPWRLVEQNLYRLNEAPRLISETLEGSEDFAILDDGSYLMAKGPKLYRFDPLGQPRWTEVADLRLYGITNITRLEANDFGRLALVAETATR